MPNRRQRTRRKNNIILDTMSNKTFIIVSSILILLIVICGFIMKRLKAENEQKIAEEKQRINSQVDEIYSATNAEIESLNNYKTNSIVRISAVGDILCGNNLQKYGKDYNNIFEDITKYLKDSDLTIGTYESNITEDTQEFANSIKNSGVNLVSLAHNHALDKGEDGLNYTKEYLESIDMQTVGTSAEESKDRVKIVEKKGIKIAILAYMYDNKKTGVNIFSEELAKEDLQYAKENAEISIVMMHWGNVNTNEISSTQTEQAKFLFDNGADLIIGAHPSAVQKMEIMKNNEGKDCFVAYSLGDYTSDFENENSNLELILNIQIYVDKENKASLYKVDYTPVYMNDLGKNHNENRFKILDMKKEIANYNSEASNIDKLTYQKLVRGIEKLKTIIK